MNNFLFGIYPYIAFTIFALGSLIRYDREPYTWKSSSSQLLESKKLRLGSAPFHIGIIAVLCGHFVGLLTPHAVWHVLGVSAEVKQLIAMSAGGFFGVVCLFGLVVLIQRRLTNERVRATSSTMDISILFLLLAQLVLGLMSIFVSADHMDGHEMLLLMAWAQNVVIFNGAYAAEQMQSVHLIFKLHVFLGMTLFVVFPFSRLVHIWSAPLKYINRNYQVVRQR
ncbi:MAG: respiratory nitrate reductase subunit gamma [Alteromonadaceae bacterium]|nr:MAG: respiratory nitrate reductase subunit gamma [Alteromonadaceae bacterium]